MKTEWSIDVPSRADLAELCVPRLDEYFGIWCILEEPFRAAAQRLGRIDLTAHVQRQQAASQESTARRTYQVTGDGIAIIELNGVLMKTVSSLSEGTSTVFARRQVRAAASDDQITAILLKIDSPGGTVSGTFDLAADVAAAATIKPVVAQIEDLGASAAYEVASQASRIFANETALVGSIGTYMAVEDLSGYAAQKGIKVHVIRAGAFKGAGVQGTEITREQLDEWQRLVNQLNEHFILGVAKGRRLAEATVRELADGRVHLAADAAKLKLIDGVQSTDATLNQLSTYLTSQPRRGTRQMFGKTDKQQTTDADQGQDLPGRLEQTAPGPASFEELKAGCPGADSDFLCDQLGRKATLAEAQTAWMTEQNRRIDAKQKEAEAAKAAAQKPGLDVAGEKNQKGNAADAFDGDAAAEFAKRVSQKVSQGMTDRQAKLAVARADRDLHQAYLLAMNAHKGRKVQELIGERFEMV